MTLLTIKKDFTANGRAYQVGEHVRVAEGKVLITRGYARALTKVETGTILDEYVKSAKRLFAEEPPKKDIPAKIVKQTIDQGVLF